MSLEQFKEIFRTVAKRILKEKLSKNPNKLFEYKQDIYTAYVNLVNFVNSIYNTITAEEKADTYELLTYVANKFEECLIRLNCKYRLSESLLDIPNFEDIKLIGIEIDSEQTVEPIESETEDFHDSIPNKSNIELNQTEHIEASFTNEGDSEEELHSISVLFEEDEFKMEVPDFMRLCANTINYKYEGEATGLTPFINAIELLEQIATTNPLQAILISFLKTKLVGKAGEALTAEDNNLAAIKAKLKLKIKPESSKVLEGRLSALKMDRQSLQEFSKTAEDLADQLKRSLVMEGIPDHKANEMTVEKTIKMCRASARSDVVKSILAATTFENSKEVIAKLIVEIGNHNEEKQVLAYRSFRNQNNQNQNQNNRYNRNGQTPRNPNSNFQNNRNGNSNYSRGNQHNQNNRQFNNNNHNNGFTNGRGRGNYHNGGGRGHNNGRGGYQNQGNPRQIHYVQQPAQPQQQQTAQGNSQGPQNLAMGGNYFQ